MFVNLFDQEPAAVDHLSSAAHDYHRSGAMDEITLRENDRCPRTRRGRGGDAVDLILLGVVRRGTGERKRCPEFCGGNWSSP